MWPLVKMSLMPLTQSDKRESKSFLRPPILKEAHGQRCWERRGCGEKWSELPAHLERMTPVFPTRVL